MANFGVDSVGHWLPFTFIKNHFKTLAFFKPLSEAQSLKIRKLKNHKNHKKKKLQGNFFEVLNFKHITLFKTEIHENTLLSKDLRKNDFIVQ